MGSFLFISSIKFLQISIVSFFFSLSKSNLIVINDLTVFSENALPKNYLNALHGSRILKDSSVKNKIIWSNGLSAFNN